MFECLKCGKSYFLCVNEYMPSYCDDCEEIATTRYKQKRAWAKFHAGPCPEVKLAQFPKQGA